MIARLMLAAGFAALLAGCGSPSAQFYQLHALAPAGASSPDERSLLVGPVTVPAAHDRPQLVIDAGDSRLTLLEQQRWAGTVQRNLAEALAGNLRSELGLARVYVFPVVGMPEPDRQLLLDLQAIDNRPGRSVHLAGTWTVVARGKTVAAGPVNVEQPVSGSGYPALIAAQEQALLTISRQIATAIRAASPNMPRQP
ncbi:PqiC family protein [Crenobacter sp. SG2305]|uniref:PqiC family protein n=1 Tax=Crenobacter oryzisoli TaxID=3056844 RepID=UPI0025AA75F8|nr:PqiC family protein [Crenobacter sp. SG2305]MDN0083461.1 PqiC family protein [Crenobacter sp. SG2305]